MFNAEPEMVKRAFAAIHSNSKVLFQGSSSTGKCLSPETRVRMYDGSVKEAKDVVVGDKLMGDDSLPRNVLTAASGRDRMYRITPERGDVWHCNSSHILTMRCSTNKKCGSGHPSKKTAKGLVFDIPIEDYIAMAPSRKNITKQFHVGVEYPEKELPFDPYIYGAWLGDGGTHVSCLHTPDGPMAQEWVRYFKSIGFRVSVGYPDKNCKMWSARTASRKGHPQNLFLRFIETSVKDKEKFIREDYLINSRKNRLKLLAGLIDSDGWVCNKTSYGFCSKFKSLARQVQMLARSLGFASSIYQKTCGIKSIGFKGTYWHVNISGSGITEIPTLEKHAVESKTNKNLTNTGIRVDDIGIGDYCGFSVDGNNRFLLEDYTVTHNSYNSGVWMYLDWRRDPFYTSVKCVGTSEDQVRKHVFAHILKLHRSSSIPMSEEVLIRDSDMWMGVKGAGFEFGITAIAYKRSEETSGGVKGYKSMAVRPTKHPKFGYMSRLRLLGDECLHGDQCVNLSDGSVIPIRRIVEDRLSPLVPSYNLETGTIEHKKVIGWTKSPRNGRPVLNLGGVLMTYDHPVLTKYGMFDAAWFSMGSDVEVLRIDNGLPKWVDVGSALEAPEAMEDYVYCIEVEDNHNFFAGNICVSNCQNWPGGPFQDLNTWLSQIDGIEFVKIALSFNPESISQTVVKMAEPVGGWDISDLDRLYDWESAYGWRVCRLDAAKCENVIARRKIYHGLQTYEGFMGYLRSGGDSSPAYMCFARGFPPLSGSVNTVIPPQWPQKARGEAIFIETPESVGAVDLAFTGSDSAQMAVGRWGLASGYFDAASGKIVPFQDRLNVAGPPKPRHVLQIDQLIQLEKHDNTITMSEEIMGKCNMLGIKPEFLGLDKTGIGFGTYSHLAKVWGDVLGIHWGSGATETKILAEDKEPASKVCDGVMSEMWWAFRRWIDPTATAILINPIISPHPIQTQLTSRQYKNTKAGIKVESKDEYKARNTKSPDEADALIMLAHVVRMRSKILPGLVEQSKPSKDVTGSSELNFLSIKDMPGVDVDDSISEDGQEY